MDRSRQDQIAQEIKAHQKLSDKAYKDAKKAVARLNQVMTEENNFYLQLMLVVGDKRKKTS